MLGWLHAIPEGDKKPRCESESWPLPDLGVFSYLAGWFVELRLNFNYTEIKSWADLSGINPEPWEVQLLMLMSTTYNRCVIDFKPKHFDLKPPYDGLSDKSEITAKRLGALFEV